LNALRPVLPPCDDNLVGRHIEVVFDIRFSEEKDGPEKDGLFWRPGTITKVSKETTTSGRCTLGLGWVLVEYGGSRRSRRPTWLRLSPTLYQNSKPGSWRLAPDEAATGSNDELDDDKVPLVKISPRP
jgi:hypothetical protein